jgi:cell division protein FtsW (lipid II flippase)
VKPFKTYFWCYLLLHWLEKPRRLIHFFALIIIVLFLIIFEPDLGTAIVIRSYQFCNFFCFRCRNIRFALASFAAFLLGLILILTSPYRPRKANNLSKSAAKAR